MATLWFHWDAFISSFHPEDKNYHRSIIELIVGRRVHEREKNDRRHVASRGDFLRSGKTDVEEGEFLCKKGKTERPRRFPYRADSWEEVAIRNYSRCSPSSRANIGGLIAQNPHDLSSCPTKLNSSLHRWSADYHISSWRGFEPTSLKEKNFAVEIYVCLCVKSLICNALKLM